MSDPCLSRPPFIPEGTFRCDLCFDVFPIAAGWQGILYGQFARWTTCVPCARRDAVTDCFGNPMPPYIKEAR